MLLIERTKITTLADLERFCEDARVALQAEGEDTTGFRSATATGEGVMLMTPVRLSLGKSALTDGSAVYDILSIIG